MKQLLILTISFCTILFLSGCTANLTDPEINFEPPAYVEQMPSKDDKQDFASIGSIFGQGDNPLFSDHKAMHVNDIVTVVIAENAQSSSSGSKSLSESDKIDFLGGGFGSTGNSAAINSALKSANNVAGVSFGMENGSDYSGQGSATKDASFTTTVSARIVKVMQNGNYFIAGKREILIDNQKQIIQIGGVIRPYDIDQNNRISSAKMSEAKILYQTQGDVDRATQQGWGSKIIQAAWPF
ncbi:MAG: flagellar basal body L-ring protein FlgH [Sulfurimonas sp.]|uniref:flagellar basal body L-ring protein FlgH n=1 Tax=Sulfurimonas sp. TaxID=2022749 RepID=UPI0026226C0D|nr:flagellar basal body L-ring protein FlgH [Sulfurimonas sp.]MCW8894843.1 flagellar basal body L-ring protein FlgH [Sulfurimonas sp.]MCW8953943.1 flagellar basal body L-ring protein FlgH [Sulfurimonas sp.]MCW9067696.1 flagellar basal body L-ring protein FlgH [Sulfurimonas sp.]